MWGMREREESRMISKDSGLGQGRQAGEERMGRNPVLDMLCKACPLDIPQRALG